MANTDIVIDSDYACGDCSDEHIACREVHRRGSTCTGNSCGSDKCGMGKKKKIEYEYGDCNKCSAAGRVFSSGGNSAYRRAYWLYQRRLGDKVD